MALKVINIVMYCTTTTLTGFNKKILRFQGMQGCLYKLLLVSVNNDKGALLFYCIIGTKPASFTKVNIFFLEKFSSVLK